MKITYYLKSSVAALVILLILSTVSCTEKFDDLNKPRGELTADQLDASMIFPLHKILTIGLQERFVALDELLWEPDM